MAIVVGIDGPNESLEALRWALGEARLRATGVRAVPVWEYPFVAPSTEWTLGAPTAQPVAVDPQEVRHLAETQLAQVVSEVEPDAAGVRIEQEVIEGSTEASPPPRRAPPRCGGTDRESSQSAPPVPDPRQTVGLHPP